MREIKVGVWWQIREFSEQAKFKDPSRCVVLPGKSDVYLLYWYKRTNSDASDANAPAGTKS